MSSASPAALLGAVLRRALAGLPDPPDPAAAVVTTAADARFGDYQTNAAMTLAKARRQNPRALAAEVVARLNADPALAEVSAPAEIAGAGFVNFRLRPAFLARRLAALLADPDRLGVAAVAAPRRIVVDFSSPNVAKPMHVGHLRSTILGDCLVRVARFLGHDVVTDNHLGDWGTQFGKVIYGWKHFLDPARLAADPLAELVRIYQEADQGGKTNPAVADACRAELVRLQEGEPENTAVWRRCVELSRAELERIYARLDIRFDHWLGESFYHDQLGLLVERLLKAGVAVPSEGAVVIFFPDDPRLADKPALIRKRDGAFNYMTTDLATLEHRVQRLGAQAIWCVVGAPQSLHFEQLNAAATRLGVAVPTRHVPFGSILGEDRQIMRTRSGDNVALRDLLDEAESRARAVVETKNPALPEEEKAAVARVVGLGAVKYAELSQHRLTDYVFSWDKMLAFQGNTAPYVQNAYVRTQSIFRRLEKDTGDPAAAARALEGDGVSGDGETPGQPGLRLTEPAELRLAKKLAQFAELVPVVLDDFRPNLLANYLFELADDMHGFWEACPVLTAPDETVRRTRLVLCAVTGRILARGLALMGIGVPDRM